MSAADDRRTTRPRRLRILVGSLPIEDGATRPPAVGEVGYFPLTFREVDGVEDADGEDPMVADVRARAEPAGDGSPQGPGYRWDGTPHDRPTTWTTTLHGDGWSARWSAPRPVIGEVRLRGRLGDDLDIDAPTGVRGRVRRVRLITETIDTSADDQLDWRTIPAKRELRDVDVAPRWYDRGLVLPPGAPRGGFSTRVPADPYVVETGVLVDLDLDDVPALPPRPSIVPGSLDASGDDLWVVDSRLPLVVRVRHPGSDDPDIAPFRWEGRILGADDRRSVHADPDGCWITGSDGVHRVDDGGVRLVDDRRTGLAAVAGTSLLVTTWTPDTGTGLSRYEPDGTVLDVAIRERAVVGLVPAGDGFLVMLGRLEKRGDPMPPPERRRPWLARVEPSGEVRAGPPLDLRRTWDRLVAGDPPLVHDDVSGGSDRLRPVRDDLTLGDGAGLRRLLLRVVGVRDRLWVTMHPPHPLDIERRGTEGCWPLSDPPTPPDERQYWLLTELAPADLEPVVSTLVNAVPERVAVDGAGTVWILADGVRRVPPGDGAAAVLLDVAALLDGS